MMHLLFW